MDLQNASATGGGISTGKTHAVRLAERKPLLAKAVEAHSSI